jgi:O-antigen biosynthesis protein
MAKSWTVHLIRAQQNEGSDGRIIFRPGDPTCGWMKIRIRTERITSFSGALSFDMGRGFKPEQTVHFDFVDGAAEQIIYFPQLIEQLSLNMSGADGCDHVDVIASPLPRLAVTWAALRRNVRLAFRSDVRRRPSVLIGLKLLATGQFARFFRQLRVNANPESIEEKQYETWIRRHERLDERIQQFTHLADLQNEPIFSIILKIRDASDTEIRTAIESVLRQTYGRWELWIPSNVFKTNDPRIKTMETGGLNAVLAKASGEYVMLLESGDQFARHALHAIADELHKEPALDFLYTDEDTLDNNVRRDPFFKPDWSPEYLLASMYIGQLAVYRTDLIRQLGGFREERGNVLDYDLALRVTAQITRIGHLPEILYHRRSGFHRDSAADIQAVENHLQSQGRKATVRRSPHGESHEVQDSLTGRPMVSIIMASACKPVIIPATSSNQTAGAGYWALNSLRALRQRATYDCLEIILLTPPQIDKELADALDGLNIIRDVYQQPFNFSAATNRAAALSHGEHLLLLNDDTELIARDFIERMLSFSQQSEIGVVGAKLLYGDGTIQHAGIVMPACSPGHPFHDKPRFSDGYHGSPRVHRNFLAVTAACMMTRRSIFEELNGFDESFHMNYNDVDYCLRAVQKGYRIVYQPAAELYHHESMSKPPIERSELRAFQKRWADICPYDPFYNCNFRPEYCDYVLRG